MAKGTHMRVDKDLLKDLREMKKFKRESYAEVIRRKIKEAKLKKRILR